MEPAEHLLANFELSTPSLELAWDWSDRVIGSVGPQRVALQTRKLL
jgi:hypothetical protein